jgi:hypothetical protein
MMPIFLGSITKKRVPDNSIHGLQRVADFAKIR